MNRIEVKTVAGVGILTAIVIVLQMLGSFIKLGPFSISLVLIPIALGAILFGPFAGAFLGFVFGVVVLLTDSGAFLAINPLGTFIIVLVKGTMAGLISGITYKLLHKNEKIATIVATLLCPIVNTGLFLIGCVIFFMPTMNEWASAFGFENAYKYMIFGLVGANFLVELLINTLLVPSIMALIRRYRNRYE